MEAIYGCIFMYEMEILIYRSGYKMSELPVGNPAPNKKVNLYHIYEIAMYCFNNNAAYTVPQFCTGI